jgi:hypothetical protein
MSAADFKVPMGSLGDSLKAKSLSMLNTEDSDQEEQEDTVESKK